MFSQKCSSCNAPIPARNGNPMPVTTNISAEEVWQILGTVNDPEVPVLSVTDLGIVRDVIVNGDGVEVVITPTYTGCPAMDVISMSIRAALLQAGFRDVTVRSVLAPAWTTDWMTESGKDKLRAYGIAPPAHRQSVCTPDAFQAEEAVQCPRCLSYRTRLVSQFGSTACKSLYQCEDCSEPFDHFKCH